MESSIQPFGLREEPTILTDNSRVRRDTQAFIEQEGLGDVEAAIVGSRRGKVRVPLASSTLAASRDLAAFSK